MYTLINPITKTTIQMRLFALVKIPLILFCFPRVVSISKKSLEVKIKLNRFTKNHLKSMYFGALSVGADVTAGFLAMKLIRESGNNVSLIFKDFHADFLKRAEGHVHFVCKDGLEIEQLVKSTIQTGKRQSLPLQIMAYVPSISQDPVAKFILTLSLKNHIK